MDSAPKLNDRGQQEILVEFPRYLQEFARLEVEYDRCPSWRWIKQFRLLHAMRKLTTEYERKMQSWGL